MQIEKPHNSIFNHTKHSSITTCGVVARCDIAVPITHARIPPPCLLNYIHTQSDHIPLLSPLCVPPVLLIPSSTGCQFELQSLIHEGSLVPKTLYLSTIEENSIVGANGKTSAYQQPQAVTTTSAATITKTSAAQKQQQQNSSLYKSVHLKPGQLYELVLRNDDPKSVLTWDFDVVTGCMQFAVLRILGPQSLPLSGNDGE